MLAFRLRGSRTYLTKTPPVNFRRKLVPGLAVICAAAWFIAALHPVDQQAWLLENLLLVVFVALFFFGHRRLRLSNTSLFLSAVFVLLHIVGSHYTYARMPLGLWARDYFGLSRNHYDRFAHGAFGFLLVFPVREFLLRFSGISRRWSFWVAPAIILAVSGVFRSLRALSRNSSAPGQGVMWLGGQGDEWDAQQDMFSALVGAVMMMVLVAVVERKSLTDESPSLGVRR